MAKAVKKRWYVCGVLGEDWDENVLAETRSKARYSYWLRVSDSWSEIKITDIRVRSAKLPPVYEVPRRPMPPPRRRRRMTLAAWRARAAELFGPDPMGWRFVCAQCGRVQTMRDFVDAGLTAERAQGMANFSCLGRVLPKSNRCDWTLGGLFQIHSLEVVDEDGEGHATFEFDEPPCAVCGKGDCEHLYPAPDPGDRPKDAKPFEASTVSVPA